MDFFFLNSTGCHPFLFHRTSCTTEPAAPLRFQFFISNLCSPFSSSPNSCRSNHLLLPLKSKTSSLSSLNPHLTEDSLSLTHGGSSNTGQARLRQQQQRPQHRSSLSSRSLNQPQIYPPVTAPTRRHPQKPAVALLPPAANGRRPAKTIHLPQIVPFLRNRPSVRSTQHSRPGLRTSTRICHQQRKTNRGEEKKMIIRNKKIKTDCLAFLSTFAGDEILTVGRGVTRGGRQARSPRFFRFPCGARASTRRQWRRRVERRAATALKPINPAEILFRLQKAIPVISDGFGVNCCNCKIV